MPMVNFEALPPHARVWVFASDRPLKGEDADRLLGEVDGFLEQWKAHGAPLRCARSWKDDHFLAIGVDPTAEQASGCSIDGMFRRLQELERVLNTRLVAGGRVFIRDDAGSPRPIERSAISSLAREGKLRADSPVFDTTLTDAKSWRDRFERPAAETWIGPLVPSA